jgi:hypothetical protein
MVDDLIKIQAWRKNMISLTDKITAIKWSQYYKTSLAECKKYKIASSIQM